MSAGRALEQAGALANDPPEPVEEAEKARQLWAAAMVRAMCAARLRGRDSEDAAQEVLERVWRAQHQQEFNEEGVRRYAATLARVVPPNYDRRSVRSSPTGELGEHLWGDTAAGPGEVFERSEAVADAAARVQELLERLSPREREIIRATHLGERSTAEVAAELGLTPSGVRSAQTRAMARMRETEQAESRNPLASGRSERERRREARVRSLAEMPEGPQGRRAAEAAQRFATEQGRLPRRSELVEFAGVGSGTAQRVVRALREEQGTPAVTTPVGDAARPAAHRHTELHGHRPNVAALVEDAGVSDRTAREVLRGLDRAESTDGDSTGSVSPRAVCPAYDRAEAAAREHLERTGRWPTWREVHETAGLGRSTVAGALRSLRAENAVADDASDRGEDVGPERPEPGTGGDRVDDARMTDEVADRRASSSSASSSWDAPETGGAPLEEPPATTTDLLAPADDADREPFDGKDPLERARTAVSHAGARASGAVAAPGGEGERREQLALWRLDDLRATGDDAEHDTGGLDVDAASSSGGLR